jgi:hypothetical protein
MKVTNTTQRVIVLHGLGGSGETQISLSYAYRHKQAYDALFWINATDLHSVLSSFRRIAQALLDWTEDTRLQTPALNYTRVSFELGLDK